MKNLEKAVAHLIGIALAEDEPLTEKQLEQIKDKEIDLFAARQMNIVCTIEAHKSHLRKMMSEVETP